MTHIDGINRMEAVTNLRIMGLMKDPQYLFMSRDRAIDYLTYLLGRSMKSFIIDRFQGQPLPVLQLGVMAAQGVASTKDVLGYRISFGNFEYIFIDPDNP